MGWGWGGVKWGWVGLRRGRPTPLRPRSQYDELAGEEDGETSTAETGEKVFLEFLGESYKAFMWYDDERYEALDKELAGNFGARAGLA